MKRLLLLSILLLLSNFVRADDTRIFGKLVFKDGHGVEGALVKVSNYYTGDVFYDTTDHNGYYSFGNALSVRTDIAKSVTFNSFITNSVGRSCNFYFFDSKPIEVAYVYNILGQQVSKIHLQSEHLISYNYWSNSGFWNGLSKSENPVASGSYFIVVESTKGLQTLRFNYLNSGNFTTPLPISRIQFDRFIDNSSFTEEYIPGKTTTEDEAALQYYTFKYTMLPDGDSFDEMIPIPHILTGDELNSVVDTVDAIIPDNSSILFIGNSYTKNNNLIDVIAALFEWQNPSLTINIQRKTNGGWSLERHWYSEDTQSKLNNFEWDLVFLQDFSTNPVYHPEKTLQYAELFDSSINESGAETGFYMTWPREWAPEMIVPISSLYTSLGISLDANVAPVGLAWQKALEVNPQIDLYTEDGSHPTIQGTYLAACVFYSTIFHQSPIGIEWHPEGISFEERAFLQRIAWETVHDFNRE